MPPITVTITEDNWAQVQLDAAAIANGTTVAPTSGGSGSTGTNGSGSTGSTSGSSSGSSSGTTSTPTQTLPLKMPSGITAGAAVTLGTGPDQIQIYAASSPGATQDMQFVLIMDIGTEQVVVAGPLTVSSTAGMDMPTSQVFTLNGDFSNATGFLFSPYGNGENGLWINAFTFNFIPWEVNDDAANSRGTGTPSYGTTVYNSNGTGMTFLPPSAIPAAPVAVPAPALSQISGAMLNGSLMATNTLEALVALVPAGGTLLLPAGNFYGTALIGTACTVSGAGMGKTVISAAGLQPVQNKSALLVGAAGVTISNLTVEGASIAASLGDNAAGVRESAQGMPFTLDAVEITGCEDGILTFPDDITLTGCNIHGNGAGNSFTHEMYFGGSPSNKVTLTDVTSTCGTLSTHALKSRAGTTVVVGGTFTGSADKTGAIGGSVIDIPDGGAASITNATIVVSAGAANTLAIGYGMESALNAATGETLTLTGVKLNDLSGSGAQIQNGSFNPNAALVLFGCTYTGSKAPQISGFKTVTGAFTAAA